MNVDEINIFNNGDGTYSAEINTDGKTIVIPRAYLDLRLEKSIGGGLSAEIQLEGCALLR